MTKTQAPAVTRVANPRRVTYATRTASQPTRQAQAGLSTYATLASTRRSRAHPGSGGRTTYSTASSTSTSTSTSTTYTHQTEA